MPYVAHKRLVTIVHSPIHHVYYAGAMVPIRVQARVRPSILAAELNRIRYLPRLSTRSYIEEYLNSRDNIVSPAASLISLFLSFSLSLSLSLSLFVFDLNQFSIRQKHTVRFVSLPITKIATPHHHHFHHHRHHHHYSFVRLRRTPQAESRRCNGCAHPSFITVPKLLKIF